ncbi:MAG TPA: methyltransferase domain-containing protein [Gemmataceae bacterium]|jgi:trans-aconitate methyltransferase|nr:methyltransferase domain-containing protein [Gemmataceae bacterium]
MSEPTGYVLGQARDAGRRLEIQDQQFAGPSERLLDELVLKPGDRVVELGCGPGGMTRRILRRLGTAGVVVGVDGSQGLLDQARAALAGLGRFETVVANVSELGSWLDGADVVIGRNILHHVPMAELLVGRLRTAIKPGTRVGFIEPDFRIPVARLGYLEATGRSELAPLRVWATVINQLYQARDISPAVGATLGPAMEAAGYRNVRTFWSEYPTDAAVVENLVMFYDEVRDTLGNLKIQTSSQVDEQQRLLRDLSEFPLPAAWGAHVIAAEA